MNDKVPTPPPPPAATAIADFEIRELARHADVDIRSARRRANGEEVRGRAGERLEKSAREMSLRLPPIER